MIFQEPMTALNPLHTVGAQIVEVLAAAREARPRRGARARDRPARAHRHPRAGAPRRRLSAPALGRPAPARDDRDGARLPAAPAHRRRADDRARRDDPGADPRPARRAAGRDGDGAPLHHPRPQPGAPLHAPGRRHGARQAGRDRADRGGVRARRSTATRRRCSRAGRQRAVAPVDADAPVLVEARDVRVSFEVAQRLVPAPPLRRGAARDAAACAAARRSASSANRGRARRRSAWRCSRCSRSPTARSRSTARASTAPTATRCAPCGAASRSSSRIRSARSARA